MATNKKSTTKRGKTKEPPKLDSSTLSEATIITREINERAQRGIAAMMNNVDKEQFPTGAVRRRTEPCRLDLIPLEALEGYGDRLHYGAAVRGYGDRNWEKGIPYSNLAQHAITHTARLCAQLGEIEDLSGEVERIQTYDDLDEEGNFADSIYGNACAALWNLAAIVTFLRRGNPAERKKP